MNWFSKIFGLVFHRSPNPDEDVEIDGGHKENFVLIRGGEFTMGSPVDESAWSDGETLHKVKVSDFSMGRYAVTVSEFRSFVDATGFRTDAEKEGDSRNWRHDVNGQLRLQSEDNHPVMRVSWNDAVAYCEWMSKRSGKTYRLPTEAEREYACRAGTTSPFNTGNNLTTEQANYDGNMDFLFRGTLMKYQTTEQANYDGNPKGVYRKNTVPVNSFSPNAWGLYNMHGNVWEWCSDWYGDYPSGTVSNPAGPATGSDRVLRGGSWDDSAGYCRSANRDGDTPDNRNNLIGFRLVFVP